MAAGATSERGPHAHGATVEHCIYCFEVLLAALRSPRDKIRVAPRFDATRSAPFFVTFKKRQPSGEYHLRGCIGSLSPLPLSALGEYALKSAFHDRRFDPIEMEEVPRLQCGVSILVDFEEGKKWNEWEPGKHGIILEFTADGERYSATYLPEVAAEQGWTVEETLDSLARKAGFRGRVTHELRKTFHITRYQSTKAEMNFDEFERVSGK